MTDPYTEIERRSGELGPTGLRGGLESRPRPAEPAPGNAGEGRHHDGSARDRGTVVRVPAHRGDREIRLARGHAGSASGFRDRDGHRGPAPRGPRGHRRPGHPRVHRSRPVPDLAEHVGRRRRRGGPADCPAVSCRRAPVLDQARGHAGAALSPARSRGDAEGRRAHGGRPLHRAAVHRGRPRAGQAVGGGGMRDGDAPRLVDRLEQGAQDARRRADHRGTGDGPGRGRRGTRCSLARRRGHGAWRGRRSGEHGHRGGPRPRADGEGLRAGSGGGAPCLPGREGSRTRRGRGIQPADRVPGTDRRAVTEIRRRGGQGLRPVDHPADRHGDGFAGPPPRVTFADELERLPFAELLAVAERASPARVDAALHTNPLERTLEDFAALLSPAAAARLEDLAQASRALTIARFGRTMRMYAPLYLSNECLTTCAYCGFARELPIARKTLSPDETVHEARYLVRQGFRSILLLTGEHERLTGVEFLEERLRLLARETPQLSLEVQVWSEGEYRRLAEAGCEGVVIYQGAYH